jgi:hypothetical protein
MENMILEESPMMDEIIYFKIDYYDPALQYHSEDKTDLEKTVRVMTILLAREY